MASKLIVPNWHVFTGAQCSGKSTLITAMRPHVDRVIEEAARLIIDENRRRGISVEETLRDRAAFTRQVAELKLGLEAVADREKLTFLDRGVPDSIPYMRLHGLDASHLYAHATQNRYRSVFFLEMLPYKRDYARSRDEKIRTALNYMLPRVYASLGYDIIHIPRAPVDERVEMVLAHLKRDAAVDASLTVP